MMVMMTMAEAAVVMMTQQARGQRCRNHNANSMGEWCAMHG